MFKNIVSLSKSDVQLARLFEKTKEYAQIYLLAKQRQKGCDEMGEAATLKDEFICMLNDLIRYCGESRYLSGDISYDIDSIAREITGMRKND